MDDIDRRIINGLQGGFPICDRPFAVAATSLGLSESDLLTRVERLAREGWLTRFGPLYNADRLGGATALAAMRVPEVAFDDVADIVNSHPEVAHNYARNHSLNMWFVIASDDPDRIDAVASSIEAKTGLKVLVLPKIEEFFVDLRFEA